VEEILQQLELNSTFFIEFAIFLFVFLVLSKMFFKPFLQLFETRYQRTVQDRQAALEMIAEAEKKFEEYELKLSEAKKEARKEYEEILSQAKQKEAQIIFEAREAAKSITLKSIEDLKKQKEAVEKELHQEVEGLAKEITDRLLAKEQ
tara:strand:+ start:2418 stop:2861 length:444 start_codon:yes stop_codon:yes gene_type:complete